MKEPVREVPLPADPADESWLTREWLVTNGLGGYASGTLSGIATRRYHGLLIAALPTPHGRTMMLDHLSEELRLGDGEVVALTGHLCAFRLELGLPVWTFRVGERVIEKLVFMTHGSNTTFVCYRLLGGAPARLVLIPAVHLRPHDAPVSTELALPYMVRAIGERYELSGPGELPPLKLLLHGERRSFTLESKPMHQVLYRTEEHRGYPAEGRLFSPGRFGIDLGTTGADAVLVASTEPWEAIDALTPIDASAAERQRRRSLIDAAPPAAQTGVPAELVLAADQFIITPAGRLEDAARAHAFGDEIRTVIAGYHWFTDWGRDTMISLEGLALCTGRHLEAGYILRTFAHYVRDGLIPNFFPDAENQGVYHTADATLWFFHALDRYLAATRDQATLELLLPTLRDIVEHHLRGTRFGIRVDPADGLLAQGAPGYQLTWMDAKVDDWVVTPRRGKAVEINALWYNALRLLQGWLEQSGAAAEASTIAGHAERAQRSFNERFWYDAGNHLYDVIDGENGDAAAVRPNQIFAVSLPHPVLARARWAPVVESVRTQLLTPVGLRSLAPSHPDFKARYWGDLRARDAAYHQGTVWSWLIGPYVDAWLKVHPGDRAGAHALLAGLAAQLSEACIGSVSEIFDAEPPFTPRGCIAQAWGVAELLRSWLETA